MWEGRAVGVGRQGNRCGRAGQWVWEGRGRRAIGGLGVEGLRGLSQPTAHYAPFGFAECPVVDVGLALPDGWPFVSDMPLASCGGFELEAAGDGWADGLGGGGGAPLVTGCGAAFGGFAGDFLLAVELFGVWVGNALGGVFVGVFVGAGDFLLAVELFGVRVGNALGGVFVGVFVDVFAGDVLGGAVLRESSRSERLPASAPKINGRRTGESRAEKRYATACCEGYQCPVRRAVCALRMAPAASGIPSASERGAK